MRKTRSMRKRIRKRTKKASSWDNTEEDKEEQMEITIEMVKNLRQMMNAGILDCKKALQEADGDLDKAVAILRKKGMAIAEKKADREAKQGLVEAYVHAGSKVAALVEVNCETDFVARTDQFKELAHDLAMQVVASRPSYLRVEDVPAGVVEGERRKYRAELEGDGKPVYVVEQIVQERLTKFFEENCLMEQPFIKNGDMKIRDLVTVKIAAVGENIVVRRFVRYELGEQQ